MCAITVNAAPLRGADRWTSRLPFSPSPSRSTWTLRCLPRLLSFSPRPDRHTFIVQAGADTEDNTSTEKESVADPKDIKEEEEEEDPIWVRRERLQELQKEEASETFELPFFVSLLLSAVIAIAAVGSVFEIANKHALFGVIPPENPLWLPILAFFALTGLPVSGYFFFSSVAAANKLADQMDRIDNA